MSSVSTSVLGQTYSSLKRWGVVPNNLDYFEYYFLFFNLVFFLLFENED